MEQWTKKKFLTLLKENGYHYDRNNGSHSIYVNEEGSHISVPYRIKAVIAQRLIKEHKLKTYV